MPDFCVAASTDADIAPILSLQAQNHISTLPDEARGDGFVTTRLDEGEIAALRQQNGLMVARGASGEVVGYACAHVWHFAADHPFQMAVHTLFPLPFEGETITGDNSFQYGPVCIAAPYRGAGVIELLFGAIKGNFVDRFPFGITFIDERNQRSLAAHERKLGFHRLTHLAFDHATYHVLGFSTR